MADDSIAKNMLEQLVPTDRSKSVEDNFYDLIGFDNPAAAQAASVSAAGSGMSSADLEYAALDQERMDEITDRAVAYYDNEIRAAEAEEEGAMLPAIAKAIYASQNFGDNIEQMIMVHGAKWALANDKPDLAAAFAEDNQWGMTFGSTRGGNYGFYHETISPEELYGENWKELTSDQMFDKLAERKAQDIEKYYGGVKDNWLGDKIGWALGEFVFDAANLAPTGYVGLAGKFGKIAGATKGKIAAGAATGLAWAVADQMAALHVREHAMDPARIAGAAVFGTALGGALPAAGAAFNAFITRLRLKGTQATPEDVQPLLDDAVTGANDRVKQLEALPKPEDPEELAVANAKIAEAKAEAAELAEMDARSIVDIANRELQKGKETDAQGVIDASLRFFHGTQTESMDLHKYANRMARVTIDDDLAHVLTSKAFARLSDEEKKQVDSFIRIVKEIPPDPKIKSDAPEAKEKSEEVIAAKQAEIMDRTEKHMEVLSKHGKAYKQDILRSIVHDTGLSAAVGTGSYLATGDEDFAIAMAIATGGVAVGSQVFRKVYSPIDDVKQRSLSTNEEVRIKANEEIVGSRAKAFLSGTSPMTTNNWTTTPQREWNMRGGIGKTLARELERVAENIKIGVNSKLINYGQIMRTSKLSQKDSPTVAHLLTHQLSPNSPGVTKAHVEAAQEIRKLLNNEIRLAQKAGVLTKAEADGLIANAKREGYLNRVYYTDYIASKKGAAKFAEAMNAVGRKVDADGRVIQEGMKESDALNIIKALTGETEKDAMKVLTNTIKKNDEGKYVFDKESVRKLMRAKGGIAQPSKFLERGRKLPTHLEEALDPFLVRDLKTALIKYFESTTGRIENVKAFGKKNEGAAAWRRQIEKEWGSAELGQKAEDDILGSQFSPDNTYLNAYFNQSNTMKFSNNIVQHWQNAKLIASAPLNFTQHLVYLPTLMSSMGMTSKILPIMTKAYVEGVKEIGQEFMRRGTDGHKFLNQMGTLVDTITYSAAGDIARMQPNAKMGILSGITHRPDVWLRAGFEQVERWNRRVAGLVGKAIVDDTLLRKQTLMKKQGLSPKELKELETLNQRMVTLGLDPRIGIGEHTVRELDDAGTFIATDLLRDPNVKENQLAAAQSISNKTNFQSDYMHKPRMWNTPFGNWFGKFRNFMLHNTAFVRDEIIKPLSYGETRPAAAMLFTAGLAGAGVNEIIDYMRNDDEDMSATTRMFSNWLIIGALGGWMEAFRQGMENPSYFTSFVFGPVIADFFKYVNSSAQYAATGEVHKIATQLAVDFAPVKKAVALGTRITGAENPYATREEKQHKAQLRALGLSPIGGVSGISGM